MTVHLTYLGVSWFLVWSHPTGVYHAPRALCLLLMKGIVRPTRFLRPSSSIRGCCLRHFESCKAVTACASLLRGMTSYYQCAFLVDFWSRVDGSCGESFFPSQYDYQSVLYNTVESRIMLSSTFIDFYITWSTPSSHCITTSICLLVLIWPCVAAVYCQSPRHGVFYSG